jgi:hypothetical protein
VLLVAKSFGIAKILTCVPNWDNFCGPQRSSGFNLP